MSDPTHFAAAAEASSIADLPPAEQVRQLAPLLAGTDVTELHLHTNGASLRLVRLETKLSAKPPRTATILLTAGIAGLVRWHLSMDGDGRVQLGQAVAKGQILGVLQAGILSFPIAAPLSGAVAEVLAPDDWIAGYDCPLIRLAGRSG